MSNWTPQAGDGIVDHNDQRRIVDGIATNSLTGEFEGILFTTDDGRRIHLKPWQYRRETFFEYLTRPTGFGRWTWGQFAFVQLMALGAVSAGVATIDQQGWVAFVVAAAIEAVLVIWSHRNYTGKTR